MAELDLQARARRWLEPIPGAAPGGQSARLDPAYEAVAREVAKLDAPAGGEVDWKMVAAGADALLRTRTKDLTLGAYLVRALQATEGVAGLGAGMHAFAGLLEEFWETAFPELKRLRARANSAQWLVERAEAAVAGLDGAAVDLDTLRAVEGAARRLADVLRARLGEAAPAVGSLLSALPSPAPAPR